MNAVTFIIITIIAITANHLQLCKMAFNGTVCQEGSPCRAGNKLRDITYVCTYNNTICHTFFSTIVEMLPAVRQASSRMVYYAAVGQAGRMLTVIL